MRLTKLKSKKAEKMKLSLKTLVGLQPIHFLDLLGIKGGVEDTRLKDTKKI